MDTQTTPTPAGNVARPATTHAPESRRGIRNTLRMVRGVQDAGTAVVVLGHDVSWGRRFRAGSSGRWDPVYVIRRRRRGKAGGDCVVLGGDAAADFLFAANAALAGATRA